MLKVVINSGILNIINARPKTKLYKKKRKEYPSVYNWGPHPHMHGMTRFETVYAK